MATTKAKESTSLGKEKKATSSNSHHITSTRRTAKTSATSSSTATATTTTARPSSTTPEKQVPNYLRPTASSRPESNSFKYVKKQSRDDQSPQKPAALNRRRSFDKPPSPSRLQKAFVSPGRERKLTARSSSFASKSTISSKPISEKTPKTSRDGKSQLLHSKTVKKTPSDSTVTKKVSSRGSSNAQSAKVPKAVIMDHDLDAETKREVKEALDREVEEAVKEERDHDQPHDIENGKSFEHCVEESNLEEKVIPTVSEELKEKPDVGNDEACESNPREEKTADDNAGEEAIQNREESNENEAEEDPAFEVKEETEESIEEGNEDNEKNSEATALGENEGKNGVVDEDIVSKQEQIPVESNDSIAETKREVTSTKPNQAGAGSQGRKETQAYNDVIEETASKLLEKRKNKVKALVGAFETVIDYESSSK